MYKYLADNLEKHGSFIKPFSTDMLKEDFLIVKLDDFMKNITSIDLDKVINNDEERYKDNRCKHCKYCSSKDICLRIAQN